MEPADAAHALAEIDRRREQVIRRRVFPRWWWWAYAGLFFLLATSVESGSIVIVGAGIVLFAVGAFLVDIPVRRAARAATVRGEFATPKSRLQSALGLLGFVVVLVALALLTGLGWKALGLPFPGTVAGAVAGVVFALVGPLLVRWEAAVLLRRTSRR